MKSVTTLKKAWMTVLLPFILLAALPNKSAAQFVQHTTTTTENFHYMVYDKPKSVIRLRADCSLMSCSMLLA